MEKLVELDKRKATILKTIEEQEQLTPELQQKIEQCLDPNELEDIYLPYKPKRRTRATIAREKGLEPLAKIVMKQFENDPEGRASRFLSDEVPTVEDALAGARDIIAEWCEREPRSPEHCTEYFRAGWRDSFSFGERQGGGRHQIPGLF